MSDYTGNSTTGLDNGADVPDDGPGGILKPAHTYPTTYVGAWDQIELTCACHPHIHGSGYRAGLTFEEHWPTYRVHSWAHPEFNGWLYALSPAGLLERAQGTVADLSVFTSRYEKRIDRRAQTAGLEKEAE